MTSRISGVSPATTSSVQTQTRARTRVASAFLAMLGFVVIYGVGFSPVEAFHNAAHDTRHSNGFPCH
jgi:cobalt transporter subunit CbtB